MIPQTFESIAKIFTDARQETDGSFSFECLVCRDDNHPNIRVKLFGNGALSCPRFVNAGTADHRAHCAPISEQLGLGAPSAAFLSSVLFSGDRQVTLEVERASKAAQFVAARNCTAVLHSAEVRLARPDERAAFVAAIPDRNDAERDAIGRELVQLLDRFRKAQAAVTTEEASDGRESAATRLVRLAEEAQLIHNADGDGYALMMVDGHKETWPLRSKGFKRWLQRRFFEQFDKAPGAQAVQDALGVIEGKALYDGPERRIFVRVGERDGKVYLDLADEQWRAVEIDAEGWHIVDIPPVEFRRAKGMLPLPMPERGGSVEELRPFLNLESGDLWTLMLGSLVMKLRPRGPYNVDVFTGEQGCGKTTRARVIRKLIDPSVADVRSEPREVRDLQIAASNEWLPVFDNLSKIPAWLSDAFCCLSTGGALRTRELYSDSDEVIFATMRPQILTSITEVVERPDLLDRALIFNLPVIEKKKRKPEKRFWAEFEAVRPRILGALLNAVSCALRSEDQVVIDEASRLADFERWAVAAEPALSLKPGAFLRAYRKNQVGANLLALEVSPISEPVIALAEREREWMGTAQELFNLLTAEKDENEKRKLKELGWPATPKALSEMLRRLAPNLRNHGVETVFGIREGKNRVRKIKIRALPKEAESEENETNKIIGGNSASAASANPQDAEMQELECGRSDAISVSAAASAAGFLRPPDGPHHLADAAAHTVDALADAEAEPMALGQAAESRAAAATADAADAADAEKPTQSCLAQIVALDTETERFDERRGITPRNAQMIGLSLSHDGQAADYVTDPEAWLLLLPEPEQTAVFHNAKFDLSVLRRTGLPLPQQWECSLIAARLLNETGEHGLKPLVKTNFGINLPEYDEVQKERLFNPGAFDEYAKNDARFTFRLWQQFEPELARQGLRKVYELEKRLLPVVLAMEERGMLVDVAALRKAGEETQTRLQRLEADIYEHAGCKFNLRAPQKLAVILREKLGLPLPAGGAKGAPCVDKHALKDLAGQHPIIPPLLEYRELDKLASAFIEKLPGLADAEGRIHPAFNQLGATSGRFTCSNPNVQQMPRSSGLAALLRASFIAGPGRKLVCADWSQIELRVLAHYSQDTALIEAFLSGADLHARTAARMFGKPETSISKRERTIAKSINFGIAYGMGAPGLFKNLNAAGLAVSLAECAEFIKTYHASYPGVRHFLDSVGRKAQQQGFARALSGRKRRLNADGDNLLSVKNAVIQGSAADIAKLTMVRLHRALPTDAHLIAMIHDEMIVDCRTDQAEAVLEIVRAVMERQPKNFKVPLVVDAQLGDNWGACK